MTTSNQKESRGIFITVLLALTAGGVLFGLYGLVNMDQVKSTSDQLGLNPAPLWLLILSYALQAAAVIGIWTWKKWGVYAITSSLILGLITQIVAKQAPGVGVTAYAITIFYAGIWFWAIYRKWKFFK